jgi:hypothetical protein
MIEMPEPCVQTELDLFAAPSFEELLSARQIPDITVTVTRRLRRGWHATINQRTGMRSLHVPVFLATAPAEVKQALIDWTLLLSHRRPRVRTAQCKTLEHTVFAFIKSQGLETRNRTRTDPRAYVTRGILYDLSEVFDAVNKAFFEGGLSSYVRWGRHPLRSFQSTRSDANGATYNLITIASMYNRPDTPRYAIEAIMYHEMLHIACPPRIAGGRNVIHGPEFKRSERLFPRREEWIAWEKRCSRHIARRG